MFLLNLIFLIMMILLCIAQVSMLWMTIRFHNKAEGRRIPWSNILMTTGSLLLALCAYIGLRDPFFTSRTAPYYGAGMILLIAGGWIAYRQVRSGNGKQAILQLLRRS
jgi:hypothetical protein